jgi:hypothetical protein
MTFNLFGYTVTIEKKKSLEQWLVNGKGVVGGCKVAQIYDISDPSNSGNCVVLTDPYGCMLPKQKNITIDCPLNGPMTATVTFLLDGIEHNPLYPYKGIERKDS